MTNLSDKDGKLFQEMLKLDAEPNEVLKQSTERYCKMNSQTEFFECICTSDEHTLRFKLDVYDPKDVELYTSVFLNQYHNFFGRLWIAIKYLFGYKCKYGHWDCTILRLEDVDRLIALLQKYKQLKDLNSGMSVNGR